MAIIVNLQGQQGGGGGTTLPPIGTIATRPHGLSGCLQTFTETTLPNGVRSQAEDNQTIKVRRRATAPTRTADATVMLQKDDVAHFKQWFETDCHGGALPTRFKMPWGAEEVWRFASEPTYDWSIGRNGRHLCQASFKLEKLPQYIP